MRIAYNHFVVAAAVAAFAAAVDAATAAATPAAWTLAVVATAAAAAVAAAFPSIVVVLLKMEPPHDQDAFHSILALIQHHHPNPSYPMRIQITMISLNVDLLVNVRLGGILSGEEM